DGAGEFVDLSHESLIRQWDRLRGWADEEAEKFRRFRDISGSAAQWNDHGRSDSFLKSGGELEIYERWWNRHHPDVRWAARYARDPAGCGNAADVVALTSEYLAESRKLHNRNAWRHWLAWAAPLAAVAILVIAGAAIVPYMHQQKVLQEAKA